MGIGKSWSKDEDRICCRIAVSECVVGKRMLSIQSILGKIEQNPAIAGRDINSVKMRISNIKAALKDMGIDNTLPGGFLNNYARQTKEVLVEELQKAGCI